jgi:hypothetical protein
VPEAMQKSKRRSDTESVSSPATFGGVLAIVPHHRGPEERKSIREKLDRRDDTMTPFVLAGLVPSPAVGQVQGRQGQWLRSGISRSPVH